VRLGFASALILCLILWPASADLSDVEPIVNYVLPADIMRVEFADETWVYRLYEDGRVKKIISKEKYHLTEVASLEGRSVLIQMENVCEHC